MTLDEVIAAERAALQRSREYLGLMREDVLGLRALGGDPVSEEYLKAELYHRAEALKDLPDTPLFFGRLDYGGAIDEDGVAGHSFHIGRRHVHAPDGTPAVIDWRAPVSVPFYRASAAEPMGLALRRRFGFAAGQLTAFEDEVFGADGDRRSDEEKPSQLLIEEIERPRSGPMRDIVATIAPDQDDIVRASATETVCVQGAPGTGKTAVGLHRVAYLLYTHREQMLRRGVVVVGPNRAFLSYIRNVLPALGELDVTQTTVDDLVGSVPARGTDTEKAAVIKGDARMAEVLRRGLWASLRPPAGPLVLPRGVRRIRVSAFELDELVMELRARGVRYGSGRDMLENRIAHVVLTRLEAAGEACDDRTHDAVRRSRPVRAIAEQIWPKVDPVRLVFTVLCDPSSAADGILTDAEQALITWSPAPRGPGSAKWTAADQVLIDEARDLIERTPSLAHVVVDEAQDLSPMEVRAIGRRCSTGSATVLGDLAQATTAWSTTSWTSMLADMGKPDTPVRELSVGYRVPRQILSFASSLLPLIAPSLSPASSLRTDAGSLTVLPCPSSAAMLSELVASCRAALREQGSVAVIVTDSAVGQAGAALSGAGVRYGEAGSDERICLVPVTMVKGLEFDHVIVVEPASIVAAEARGLQRLYVALTRAVSRLTVLHSVALPEILRMS